MGYELSDEERMIAHRVTLMGYRWCEQQALETIRAAKARGDVDCVVEEYAQFRRVIDILEKGGGITVEWAQHNRDCFDQAVLKDVGS